MAVVLTKYKHVNDKHALANTPTIIVIKYLHSRQLPDLGRLTNIQNNDQPSTPFVIAMHCLQELYFKQVSIFTNVPNSFLPKHFDPASSRISPQTLTRKDIVFVFRKD